MSDPFICEWLQIKCRAPEFIDEGNGIAWKLVFHGRLLSFPGEPMVGGGYNSRELAGVCGCARWFLETIPGQRMVIMQRLR